VKGAECSVLLTHCPHFGVENYLDDVLSVLPMVFLVHERLRCLDTERHRDLEKVGAASPVVFRASLHMVDKDFSWVEHLAELALHGQRVLEDTLVDLDLANLGRQLLVSIFNFGDSLRQRLVYFHQVFVLLSFCRLAFCLRLLGLCDCLHQRLLHLDHLLLLKLRVLFNLILHLSFLLC